MAHINELRRSTFDDSSPDDAQRYGPRAASSRDLLTRAAAMERASLARALHDDLIQSLISAEMQVYASRQRVAQKSKVVAAELLGIEKLLHQEVLSVRDLMQRIKPLRIDPEDLVDYLADHVQRFAADTGTNARFFANVHRLSLSASMCTEIARLVQEALSNVRKHSGARNVWVRLSQAAGRWSVVIEDDGRGLGVIRAGAGRDDQARHVSATSATARAGSGWPPLRHPSPTVIKECVRSLNGDLRLQSTTAGGLRLEITFPSAGAPALRPRSTTRKKMARVSAVPRSGDAPMNTLGVEPRSAARSTVRARAQSGRRR